MRISISLKCSSCKINNFVTTKKKVNDGKKFMINKFCPKCKKYSSHKEKKL